MSLDLNAPSSEARDAERIARLEARLARLEARLGLADFESGIGVPPMSVGTDPAHAHAARSTSEPEMLAPPLAMTQTEDELEFEVGQSWFAHAGIVVLTIGAAFLLSLPFAGLPVGVPALMGGALSIALFAIAQVWRTPLGAAGARVSGAAMALLFLSTLRLFFPEARCVASINSAAAGAALAFVVAANFVISLRKKSPWLTAIALLTGCATVVVAGGMSVYALSMLLLVAIATIAASQRHNWPALVMAAVPIAAISYLLWALGNPLRGGAAHFIPMAAGPIVLLGCVAALAAGAWLRPADEPEGAWAGIAALLTCGLGYGIYFAHTLMAFPARAAVYHAMAFAAFLGIATAFWVRRQSRAATFLYAMTGYAALSVAIFKLAAGPSVFVWLSVQSVVVVATAIWFRSRFIVVANFLIYVGIVLGYVFVVEHESGISLGFGLVALVSARILNWQQDRLELKTTLMRNAYLVGAWLVFPYALYHLVSGKYVGLAWVALALGYYALNWIVQNQKYRWMGHATLLLTTCYLVIIGTSRFEPIYRVLSFLVLGTVLMVVSLVFTWLRRNRPIAKQAVRAVVRNPG